MPKITVFVRNADGSMPWQFTPLTSDEEARWKAPELEPREIRDLVKTGVWAKPDTPEAQYNWLRPGKDGEVWAGGPEAPRGNVAKVRGKGGRITGGSRNRIPPEAKVKSYSVQMPPTMRKDLEDVAAELAARTGKNITVSKVLLGLVEGYLEAYKQEQGIV